MKEHLATHEETKRLKTQNNCNAYHKEAAAQKSTYQATPSLSYKAECAKVQAEFDLKRKKRAVSYALSTRTKLPEIPRKPPTSSLQGEGGYGAECFKSYKEKYKHEEKLRFKDHSKVKKVLNENVRYESVRSNHNTLVHR